MNVHHSLRKRDDRPQVRMTLSESTQQWLKKTWHHPNPRISYSSSLGAARKSKVILLLDLLVRIDDPIDHPLHIAVPILRRLQRDRDQRHPRRRPPHGREQREHRPEVLPLERPRQRPAPGTRFRRHARLGDVIEEVRPPPARRAYHLRGRRVPPRQFALGEYRRLSHLVDATERRQRDEVVPHGRVGDVPQRLDDSRVGILRGRVREEDRAAPSRQGLLGPVPRGRDAQAERVVGVVVRTEGRAASGVGGAGGGGTRRVRREEDRGGGAGAGAERSTSRRRGGGDAAVCGRVEAARRRRGEGSTGGCARRSSPRDAVGGGRRGGAECRGPEQQREEDD